MTKAEIIEKIAIDAGIPKATVKVAIDSALESIKTGLKKGQQSDVGQVRCV